MPQPATDPFATIVAMLLTVITGAMDGLGAAFQAGLAALEDEEDALIAGADVADINAATRFRGKDRADRSRKLRELLAKPNEDFRRDLRITRPTFEFIVKELEPLLQRPRLPNGKRGPGKPRCSTAEQVALAIYYYATGMPHRTVANQFGVGNSTVNHTIVDVALAIRQRFQHEMIRFPDRNDDQAWRRLRFGFGTGPGRVPNVVAALDGMHVGILAPPSSKTFPRAYRNYKGFYSFQMQAIVGPDLQFMDVDCGWPGSTSDARIWTNSAARAEFIGTRNGEGILPDDNFIIADKIYESTMRLVVPFRDYGALSRNQLNFNIRIAKARAIVERGFGMLQARFRCLADRKFEINYLNVPTITVACVILHNICLQRNEPLAGEEYQAFLRRDRNLLFADFEEELNAVNTFMPRHYTPEQRDVALGNTLPLPVVADGPAFRNVIAELISRV